MVKIHIGNIVQSCDGSVTDARVIEIHYSSFGKEHNQVLISGTNASTGAHELSLLLISEVALV